MNWKSFAGGAVVGIALVTRTLAWVRQKVAKNRDHYNGMMSLIHVKRNSLKEMKMNRFRALLFTMALVTSVAAAGSERVALYKTPACGCCEAYADYLRDHGFRVEVIPTHDLPQLKVEHGVPDELGGCHTALIDGYVFEGHIPVDSIQQVLEERPHIRGLSVPGMPMGSPGMTGSFEAPMPVWTIPAGADDAPQEFHRYESADSWR